MVSQPNFEPMAYRSQNTERTKNLLGFYSLQGSPASVEEVAGEEHRKDADEQQAPVQ